LWPKRYDRYLAHISKLIEKINAHMPKERKTLAELLAEEEPFVEAVDGSKIYFKRGDLERLAERLPRELHGKIFLPIVVVRRLELGKGIYVVYGGALEKRLVADLLGLRKAEGELQLYRPQVSLLLSKLKSLLTIGFEAPEDSNY